MAQDTMLTHNIRQNLVQNAYNQNGLQNSAQEGNPATKKTQYNSQNQNTLPNTQNLATGKTHNAQNLVYILEDDEHIAELVAYALKNQNLNSMIFEDASSLYEALKSEIPKVLVCDIMLPNESGLEVIQKLRANPKTSGVAIIVLSALGSEYDKINGLDLGADDYLTKPFSALELIARIKALMRRSNATMKKGEILQYKGLKIQPNSHKISVDESPLHLTSKEFELLLLLFTHQNNIFSKDELLESIWGYSVENTRTVDMHISSLRTKLGIYGKCITNIRSVGYRFDEVL